MQNAEYVVQRNALIPSAVRHANKAAGANPQSNADRDAWNRAFHGKMNDLARPLTSGQRKSAVIKGRA
jgi:hypothetical protein